MSESSHTESDVLALDRLKRGDIGALATIFRFWGPQVFRLSRRLMGNQADAEDATQEIFVRVFEQAAKFDGRSRFSTWLYRLAVRHCLNKIKARQRRAARERMVGRDLTRSGLGSGASPDEQISAKEDAALVDRLLESLPPHYRACVVLREIEGLSYARIAEILDVPPGTVMSRLARARQALRAKYAEVRRSGQADWNNDGGAAVERYEGVPEP